MAAYSGRRGVFAAYPPVEDGLAVKSEGPAPLNFEYKLKDELLLVSYVAPRPGRYRLSVSRFGRQALGSPFVLTVEEAPQGYTGKFGAGIWYQVPVQPPILSGIVNFITEKMYMDEHGRLFKLNKDGSISGERYLVKRKRKTSVQEIDKGISSNLQKSLNTKQLQIVENLQNVRKNKDKKLSKAIFKELNDNSKILKSLTHDCNDSDENIVVPRNQINIPKITITHHSADKEPLTERNQSKVDQFLSGTESCYTARRTAKLERAVADDAVIGEPCDGRGQIGALPRGQSRNDISTVNDRKRIDFIPPSGRNSKTRKKYYPSNIVTTLGLSKSRNNLTGIKLLHDIYRVEENTREKQDNRNICRTRVLNNLKTQKKDCRRVYKLAADRDLEINNLETNSIPPKVYNSKQIPTSLSDSHINTKQSGSKLNRKLTRKRHREPNKISESFRTLSLPDFSRLFSLSVQGLRKAKSCGDRSFRVLSSSSFSIRNLFEKDRAYHFNKKYHPDKTNSSRGAATLVRIAHYGSEKETKLIETGYKSVDEWKKFWESAAHEKEKEVARECSLQIKGIVTKGKEIFDTNNEEASIISKQCLQRNIDNSKSEKMEEHKSAVQKSKEIFEGNYTSLKDLDDPRYKRKTSISERFHISSLSKDIYSGVTPGHLGIPNRLPVVASLGSIYSPLYSQFSPTLSQEYGYSLPWNDLLFSDPSYV